MQKGEQLKTNLVYNSTANRSSRVDFYVELLLVRRDENRRFSARSFSHWNILRHRWLVSLYSPKS